MCGEALIWIASMQAPLLGVKKARVFAERFGDVAGLGRQGVELCECLVEYVGVDCAGVGGDVALCASTSL